MMDLYLQLLRAERKTNYFIAKKDEPMTVFWSQVYYFLRRKVHALEKQQ